MLLHGMVHGLYFGQSSRLFELRPGMQWPDASWIFSQVVGEKVVRSLASFWCIIAALGFVIGGIFSLSNQASWRPVVMVSSILSSIMYILFWDGKLRNLGDQGGFGILINIGVLVVLTVLPF